MSRPAILTQVDIIDLDGDTVHDMIIYIYSGKVGCLWPPLLLSPAQVAEVEGKATGLLSAAEKYDLKELKTMCETALCDTITQDNVLGTPELYLPLHLLPQTS